MLAGTNVHGVSMFVVTVEEQFWQLQIHMEMGFWKCIQPLALLMKRFQRKLELIFRKQFKAFMRLLELSCWLRALLTQC